MKSILLAILFTITGCASQSEKQRQQTYLNEVKVDHVLVLREEQLKVLKIMSSPETVSSNRFFGDT